MLVDCFKAFNLEIVWFFDFSKRCVRWGKWKVKLGCKRWFYPLQYILPEMRKGWLAKNQPPTLLVKRTPLQLYCRYQ